MPMKLFVYFSKLVHLQVATAVIASLWLMPWKERSSLLWLCFELLSHFLPSFILVPELWRICRRIHQRSRAHGYRAEFLSRCWSLWWHVYSQHDGICYWSSWHVTSLQVRKSYSSLLLWCLDFFLFSYLGWRSFADIVLKKIKEKVTLLY